MGYNTGKAIERETDAQEQDYIARTNGNRALTARSLAWFFALSALAHNSAPVFGYDHISFFENDSVDDSLFGFVLPVVVPVVAYGLAAWFKSQKQYADRHADGYRSQAREWREAAERQGE